MSFKICTKEELEALMSSHWDGINQFIDQQIQNLPIPIYSSVDIRESKKKFAPVDHNLYPAGFNNLCQLDLNFCGKLFSKAFKKFDFPISRIAIIPEAHTKNIFYLDHLAFLGKCLSDEGLEVDFVSLSDELFLAGEKSLQLLSASKFEVKIKKGKIREGNLCTDGSPYDLAILNNDQSSPLDVDWHTLATPILPTPQLGWAKRRKTLYFSYYQKVVEIFASKFSINPELLQAKFHRVEEVDFSSKENLQRLALQVENFLGELPSESKIFLKASQGTYGMGISVISSGDEVLRMNRKARNKMNVGKNKLKFTSLLLQEGIESVVKYDNMAAEVSIYLVDGKPAGGFVRANPERGSNANLNSKGMLFHKYCISEIRQNNDAQAKEAAYSIIARLATWASALEIQDLVDSPKG